ncbi:GH11628 [Drosophila grimshawi]|uniref:GH11628 n=1 Tax=Drosophila grimshawi TaxID=7222 RepID=B4JC99_DROGR|nr:GH11628 [Drosophila grimshawi]
MEEVRESCHQCSHPKRQTSGLCCAVWHRLLCNINNSSCHTLFALRTLHFTRRKQESNNKKKQQKKEKKQKPKQKQKLVST